MESFEMTNYLKTYTNQSLENLKNGKYRYNLGCWFSWHTLLSKYSKEICFLLCVIDIYSKYAWVISLKDTVFQKILDESGRKPDKI